MNYAYGAGIPTTPLPSTSPLPHTSSQQRDRLLDKQVIEDKVVEIMLHGSFMTVILLLTTAMTISIAPKMTDKGTKFSLFLQGVAALILFIASTMVYKLGKNVDKYDRSTEDHYTDKWW